MRGFALHAVDAVGLVHAMILRIQALMLPIQDTRLQRPLGGFGRPYGDPKEAIFSSTNKTPSRVTSLAAARSIRQGCYILEYQGVRIGKRSLTMYKILSRTMISALLLVLIGYQPAVALPVHQHGLSTFGKMTRMHH